MFAGLGLGMIHNHSEPTCWRHFAVSKITLDGDLRSKLNGLNEQLELCAEDGTTLGRFVPEAVFQQIVYAALKQHHTAAELEELDRQTGGSSLEDIWRRLGR
jgi:hypothetical protein